MRTIKSIFSEDQSDRKNPDFIGEDKYLYYKKRDQQRRLEVKKLLSKKEVETGGDLYKAAIIFHHSQNISDLKKAKQLCEKSTNKKFIKSKWLYAAITDRMLIHEGKPQKFGTQYLKKNKKDNWKLAKYDKKTTDHERSLYNVPSIEKIKEQIAKLNGKIP